MKCFNEYYVGKIANFMGNVGFIEKRAAKWRNRRQFILWRMIFRNKIPNRVRNDDITIFGMTDFFWFWNITYYASGWGWWNRKKNDTRLKMSKDISIFNLGRKNWGYTNKCIPNFIVKIVFLFSFFHYKTYIDCFKCIFNAIVYCVYSGCIC